MTLNCVIPTQSSVIQIIHCSVDLKCLFSILPKCSFVIIVIHAYVIHISQGSVEMHLRCGGIYNNHIIANCLQSVTVNFENCSLISEDMDKSKGPRFYGPRCIYVFCKEH